MARDSTGIKRIAPGVYEIRVNRIEARTGMTANRKATIKGTLQDALAARDELRRQLASTVEQRPKIRFAEYARSWLARRVANGELRATTVRRYGYSLEHIIPILGDVYVNLLTRDDVIGYVAMRRKQVGVTGGHSILNELRLLRTLAKDSVAEGFAASDWAARVRQPPVRRYSKDRPNRLTLSQAFLVIGAIPKAWQPITWTLITTGLRWGEVSAIDWSDIDPKTNEAEIKRTNDRGTLVDDVKTESSRRTVPILDYVMKLIGPRRKNGLVFAVTRGDSRGKPHRGYPLVNMLKRACKKVSVPYVTTHGLRRTFVNLGRQLTEQTIVKAMSGHSTDAMVEHYSHVELAEKQALARAILEAIRSAKPDEEKPE